MRSVGFVFVLSLGACVGADPASTQPLPAPDNGLPGTSSSTITPTGLVKTSFNGEGDVATRVVLQADGRILVAGKVGSSNYGIARYWP